MPVTAPIVNFESEFAAQSFHWCDARSSLGSDLTSSTFCCTLSFIAATLSLMELDAILTRTNTHTHNNKHEHDKATERETETETQKRDKERETQRERGTETETETE